MSDLNESMSSSLSASVANCTEDDTKTKTIQLPLHSSHAKCINKHIEFTLTIIQIVQRYGEERAAFDSRCNIKEYGLA